MATQEFFLGAWEAYAPGDSGWTNQYNYNMRLFAFFSQPRVISRALTAAPGSPADGDAYIVAAGATGTWIAKDKYFAIWRVSISNWEFYAPRSYMHCTVIAENKLIHYVSGSWNTGIAI